MTPLSHHEILPLVAPFAQRGRHLDLAKTDRLARRLVFKSIVHADPSGQGPTLTEALTLDAAEDGPSRLTRTLTDPRKLTATLYADGEDRGALLAAILDIEPHRQFRYQTATTIAFSYRIAPGSTATDAGPLLTGCVARLGPVQILFDFRAVHDQWIPIRIQCEGAEIRQLPADLLAVLGPAWHRVRFGVTDWQATMQVARDEPERTRDGERKAAETVAHLADTLARAPGEFHLRHRRARWQTVQRGVQVLLAVFAVLAGGPLLFTLAPDGSVVQMLAYFWPVALLMVLPLFIQRLSSTTATWPRPLPATAWQPIQLVEQAVQP